jgi:hypothetical protein
MEKKNKSSELLEKIKKGVDLAFKKMWEEAKKENREMVFFRDGKIVKVKARDA